MATLYPNGAAMLLAANIRTYLAAGKLKLFKALAGGLTPATVIGDFTEADYDGYAEVTVTTWLAVYLDPAGGASFQTGTKQFQYGPAGVPPVQNTILGWYYTNAAGDLIAAGTFTAPIAMGNIGDALPLNVTLNWARSQ